jgi:ubiquinone/menaquinone biosynthesis C-methylase UbiE
MIDNSDRRIAEKIFQFVDLKNKQVLEVGCGNGRITSLLVGKSDKLIAIDPNIGKIKEARNQVISADFRIGSGDDLDFPDECFDVVIFTLSLHHQNSQAALREATRVLKNRGEILVIEPVNEGEVERIFTLAHSEEQAVLEAQQSIKECGLSVAQSERFNAKWIFDSKEDLCQSIFDHYDMPFDINIAEQIFDRLGAKLEDQPIELLDTMIILSIKKPDKTPPTEV